MARDRLLAVGEGLFLQGPAGADGLCGHDWADQQGREAKQAAVGTGADQGTTIQAKGEYLQGQAAGHNVRRDWNRAGMSIEKVRHVRRKGDRAAADGSSVQWGSPKGAPLRATMRSISMLCSCRYLG